MTPEYMVIQLGEDPKTVGKTGKPIYGEVGSILQKKWITGL